jgi:hypothetical protein
MKCPNCGSLIPDTALHCDCGYSFEKKLVDGPATPPDSSSWRRAYWPTIWNLKTARSAAMQGFWAAVLVAAITAALSLLSAFGVKLFDFDLSALTDAAAFAVIAFGIYRMSRLAALAGLSLYVLERAYMWATLGPKNPAIAAIFTLAFVSSVRGTFAYRKQTNSRVTDKGSQAEPSGSNQ